MTVHEVLASHPGWCPCGKYIRAGISSIATLGVKLPPDPAVCWFSGEQQRWYVDGAEGSVRARLWLHAACASRLDDYTYEELELLADDRRHELAAIKRRHDRVDNRRQVGRRQRSKSAKVWA